MRFAKIEHIFKRPSFSAAASELNLFRVQATCQLPVNTAPILEEANKD